MSIVAFLKNMLNYSIFVDNILYDYIVPSKIKLITKL